MNNFSYSRPTSAREAIQLIFAPLGREPRFLAGGTTLVDLMKLDVETPEHLIDINHLAELA